MLSPVNEIHDWSSKLKRRFCRKAVTFPEKYPIRETFREQRQILDTLSWRNKFFLVLLAHDTHIMIISDYQKNNDAKIRIDRTIDFYCFRKDIRAFFLNLTVEYINFSCFAIPR